MKRLRSFWLYGLFILTLVVVTAEEGLRIKGAYKTYSERNHGRYYSEAGKRVDRYLAHKPGAVYNREQREFTYEYRINALGFREREIDTPRIEPIRLLFFGDSFVEGVGAGQDSTWPRALEREMQAEHPGARVYACGTSGSDPFFNYINLEERLLRFDPTHVLFSVNSSDLNDYISRGGFGKFSGGKPRVSNPPGPWFAPIFRYSHLFRAWMIGVKGYGYDLLPPGEYTALEQDAIAAIDHCLARADSLCSARGVNFLAVTHPMALEVCTSDSLFVPSIRRLEAGLRGNFPLLRLTEPMKKFLHDKDCETYAWPVDGHYKAAGYGEMGRQLNDILQSDYPGFLE